MLKIRKFIEADRDAVRKICKDTGKKSFQKSQKKREAICHMFLDYYLDNEPDNVMVADYDGTVVGYIVCSTDKHKYQDKMKNVYKKKIAKLCWYLGIFTSFCISTSKKLDDLLGGGGFHTNIRPDFQGQKIGPKLLDALAIHLKNKGHKYMYLITGSRKTRGYGYYMHYGFFEYKKCFGSSLALAYDVTRR